MHSKLLLVFCIIPSLEYRGWSRQIKCRCWREEKEKKSWEWGIVFVSNGEFWHTSNWYVLCIFRIWSKIECYCFILALCKMYVPTAPRALGLKDSRWKHTKSATGCGFMPWNWPLVVKYGIFVPYLGRWVIVENGQIWSKILGQIRPGRWYNDLQ